MRPAPSPPFAAGPTPLSTQHAGARAFPRTVARAGEAAASAVGVRARARARQNGRKGAHFCFLFPCACLRLLDNDKSSSHNPCPLLSFPTCPHPILAPLARNLNHKLGSPLLLCFPKSVFVMPFLSHPPTVPTPPPPCPTPHPPLGGRFVAPRRPPLEKSLLPPPLFITHRHHLSAHLSTFQSAAPLACPSPPFFHCLAAGKGGASPSHPRLDARRRRLLSLLAPPPPLFSSPFPPNRLPTHSLSTPSPLFSPPAFASSGGRPPPANETPPLTSSSCRQIRRQHACPGPFPRAPFNTHQHTRPPSSSTTHIRSTLLPLFLNYYRSPPRLSLVPFPSPFASCLFLIPPISAPPRRGASPRGRRGARDERAGFSLLLCDPSFFVL